MDIQDVLKNVIGWALLIGGIVGAIWLTFFFLLYGGIMQAINSWGIDNSAVVWGIVKAVFFQCGLIPSYIVGKIALAILDL